MRPIFVEAVPIDLVKISTNLAEEGYRLMTITSTAADETYVIHHIFMSFCHSDEPLIDIRTQIDSNWAGLIPSVSEVFIQATRFESDLTAATNGDVHFESKSKSVTTNSAIEEVAGVSQIPVGPVHAGVIEPGHFRFSVIGESILNLDIELNYLSRGVEDTFIGARAEEGLNLAEHVTGDSIVAHGLAFLKAYESSLSIDVGENERIRRSLLLELERVACHVTDIGGLANDTAFGLANTQAQRIRESLSGINYRLTNHRILRGSLSLHQTKLFELPSQSTIDQIKHHVIEVSQLIEEHGIVRDRMIGTGVLSRDDAQQLSAYGYVGRASNHPCDVRQYLPYNHIEADYQEILESSGDVMGRFLLRRREALSSLELIKRYLNFLRDDGTKPDKSAMPSTPKSIDNPAPAANFGFGCVEGWRGATCYFVETSENGAIKKVKITDPSVNNWAALPIALHEAIVPDFPLVNKSFNQSYAGNDL